MASFTIPSGGTAAPQEGMSDSLAAKTLVTRAKSANAVPTIATVATLQLPNGSSPMTDGDFLNTLPDPRTPSPKPQLQSSSSETDLSGEISMLSTKLVNAINHSTGLDDSLQQARHELEAAKRRIEELEQDKASHVKDITDGVLLKKAEVDANMQKLRDEMDQVKRDREASDKAKKQMEVELENLTASLFEQANVMVADARRETEAAERRTSQLRNQLADNETLLASQQEQLQDLKGVMERMSSERDETETAPRSGTNPSTPATDTNKMSRMLDALPLSPNVPAELQPDHPLKFSHLVYPIVRSDLQAYTDFADLLKTSHGTQASHARSSSGNVSAFRSPITLSTNPAAHNSSPHLPGSFNGPSTPAANSPRDVQPSPLPPLKDSKFFKRCLTEDIEPTLRLDLAPGLSWLARRTVLTSIIAGALVIEPFPNSNKLYGLAFACALCGEDRRQETYGRRHRFRTSEEPSAQRYPLCDYCTNRLRATCDYAAFLRICRDGTWKATNDEEIKAGWDEAVRLRERMFWARIGGGVIPAALKDMHAAQIAEGALAGKDRPRLSAETATAPPEVAPRTPVELRAADAVKLATPPRKQLAPVDGESGQDNEIDQDLTPVKEKSAGLEETGAAEQAVASV